MTGKPMRRAISKASELVLAMPLLGWFRPSFFRKAVKCSRSSARSIDSTEVPISGAPERFRPEARLSGVWPPNCTMMPFGLTSWTMFITSSWVSGSKNKASEVS